jgi:hypothetical protein
MEQLTVTRAARKFGVTKQALCDAIRRGALPVTVTTVSQFRMKAKDVASYVATIPDWRRKSGRLGGLARAAAASRRRASASAGTARSA